MGNRLVVVHVVFPKFVAEGARALSFDETRYFFFGSSAIKAAEKVREHGADEYPSDHPFWQYGWPVDGFYEADITISDDDAAEIKKVKFTRKANKSEEFR